MELSKEDLKTLKLFAYMCKSYGIDEAVVEVQFYGGSADYFDNYAYEVDGPSKVELYDAISNLIQRIIDENDLSDYAYDDSTERGYLSFNFDCNERNLKVVGYSYVMSSKPMGDRFEEEQLSENYPSVIEFLNELKNSGEVTKEVYFNGGGDSGEVEAYGISRGVEDFLYRWLSEFYGGWEINEGSYGDFVFDTQDMSVTLNFNENVEMAESNGQVFYVEF
jgi:hypothetical protein